MDFSDQDYVLDFATPLTHFDTFWCRNSCAGPDAKELTSGNYSHTIIFQDMVDEPCFNCGYCTVASWAKKLGATAILIASYETPGHEKRVIHKASECIQVKHYPALEIGDVDATEIYTAWLTHPITMTITSDENLFDTMYNSSWITMQFITLGYATVVNAFGVMKLWQLHVVKKKTGHGYLAIFVVGIQVACNLQRIVFVAVDPMWSKGYFSYAVGRFMLSVSVPISLLSVVLIIITWRQVLNNSLGGSNSIWQQPFNYLLVAFGLMFSIGDLFACYISAVYGMVAASTTSGTALVLLSWGTSITVAVYGYVLIQRMKSSQLDSATKKKLRVLTIKIIGVAVGLLLVGTGLSSFGSYQNIFNPSGRLFIMYLFNISATFLSQVIFNFYIIPTRTKGSKSTRVAAY